MLFACRAAAVATVWMWASSAPAGDDVPVKPSAGLVHHRPEIAADFAQADRLIGTGDIHKALDIFEALLREDRNMLHPDAPGLFLPLHEAVAGRISKLPQAAGKAYRARVDPEAKMLTERARAGDRSALSLLLREFVHSSYGAEVLELAAHRAFDAGEFTRAVRLYRRRLTDHPAEKGVAAMLMVRLGLAHHLSGRTDAAREVVKRLRTDLPDTGVVVGGKRAGADVFLDDYITRVSPPAPVLAADAANRTQAAEMRPAEGVELSLRPRWITSLDGLPKVPENPGEQPRRFRHIHTEVSVSDVDRPDAAIVGDVVWLRFADRIRKVNLYSGRLLADDVKCSISADGPEVGSTPVLGAGGITAADGRVFAIESFVAKFVNDEDGNLKRGTGSRLVARSADEPGKTLWHVGRSDLGARRTGDAALSREDAEFLDSAAYLSAPTHWSGRVYVVAAHHGSFHGVCFAAADGKLLWRRRISSMPAEGHGNLAGSPPTISDGSVFFLTNGGTLASADAVDGELFWLRQYGSGAPAGDENGNATMHPPSPPLVAAGSVFILPSDADAVFAFRAETGEAAWANPVSRDKQRWLLGAAGNRVVLGGPGVTVLDRETGAARVQVAGRGDGVGKPALTANAVFVPSGSKTRLKAALRVPLTGGVVQEIPTDVRLPSDTQVCDLLAAGRRVFSLSSDRAMAFFDFNEELAYLADRIAKEPLEPVAYLDRGLLMLRSDRFEQAEGDLATAELLARGHEDDEATRQSADALSDLYFRRADLAADTAGRLKLLDVAFGWAYDPVRKATVRLEQARACAEAGDFTAAADRAQAISDDFGSAAIDPAPRSARTGRSALADIAAVPAGEPAQVFLRDLIQSRGPGVYERHNRRFAQEMEDARSRLDAEALERLLVRFPHGSHTDRCLLDASMAWAIRAQKGAAADGPDATRDRWKKSVDHLRKLRSPDFAQSPWRASALVGLAAVYQNAWRYTAAARGFVRELEALPVDTPVIWPDGKPRPVSQALPELRTLVGLN